MGKNCDRSGKIGGRPLDIWQHFLLKNIDNYGETPKLLPRNRCIGAANRFLTNKIILKNQKVHIYKTVIQVVLFGRKT